MTRRRRVRRAEGATLTELLVASLLLGVSLAVVGELMSLTVVANSRMNNQFDAQVSANTGFERIKRDVRMANRFLPSYQTSAEQFRLNAQTLILELPIYFLHKTNDSSNPAYLASAPQNLLNGVTLNGRTVIIYQLVSDSNNPQQYQLKVRSWNETPNPPDPDCSYRNPISEQTVVAGIVGPRATGTEPGSLPIVFTYLAKNPFRGLHLDKIKQSSLEVQPLGAVGQYIAEGISGVGIDLELSRGSGTQSAFEKSVGLHTEAFIRLRHSPGSPNYYTAESQEGPREAQHYEY